MVYQDAIMREAKRRSVQPNRVVSPSNQNFAQKTVDWGRDVGSRMVPGIWGAGMKGLDALTEGVAMHNENKRWFQENAPNATNVYADIPMNVRKSVMTGRDKAFYKKYMDLAEMAQDADRKQYYLNQADTARRNLQVTKRINYGLGQMDLDDTPFKGYESYEPGFAGFEGETGPRFDIDRFSEAMSEYLPQELESDIVTDLVEGETKDEVKEEAAEIDEPLDLSYEPETVWGPEGDPSTIMAGMEPFDITEKRVQEGVDEPVVNEIFENPEIFNKVYKFPDPTGFTNFPYGFDTPWNLFEVAKENMEEGEFTDQELLDSLVRTGYLVDNTLEE